MIKHKVNKRIHSDSLKRTHQAGEVVDLSDWPPEVIAAWEARGVVERVRGDHFPGNRKVRSGPER